MARTRDAAGLLVGLCVGLGLGAVAGYLGRGSGLGLIWWVLPVGLGGLGALGYWLVRRGLGGLRRRRVASLIGGYRGSALVYLAARLGLPDRLAAGPRQADDLADEIGAHAPSLRRVLRGLAVLGICTECADGRFALSACGRCLRSDAPRSLHGDALLCGEQYAPAWNALHHSVLTGESAFAHVFGMDPWQHRQLHPEWGALFDAGLGAAAPQAAAALLRAHDFRGYQTIADLGGGNGALLSALLPALATARGVLFELPRVAEAARARLEAEGLAHRCEVVAGSFFDEVPRGADCYLLKSVLHDWDDDRASVILCACRRALGEDGTLLIVERLLPSRASRDPQTIMADLNMLAVTGGQERDVDGYRSLLSAAGLALMRVTPIGPSFAVLEARSDRPHILGSNAPRCKSSRSHTTRATT